MATGSGRAAILRHRHNGVEKRALYYQWVHYTAGNDLPKGGVVGGHMAQGSGSDLYVVRVTTNWDGYDVIVRGYYDPASQKACSVLRTALEFTEMEILVLK